MDNCLFDPFSLFSQDYMYLDNSGKINGLEFYSIFLTAWNFEHTTIVPFLGYVFKVNPYPFVTALSKDEGRKYFQSVHTCWEGGTPSQVWTGGYPIPAPDKEGGVLHPRSGWGVPHPRSGWGCPILDLDWREPHPRSGWWGVPHLRSGQGGTPSCWQGGTPFKIRAEEYPGVPPIQDWMGVPPIETGWGYPLMGVTPIQDWMGYPPPVQDWMGYPSH